MSTEKKYVGENALLYLWGKIKTLVGTKVDKIDGKGLSTNDYTTDEKNKLNGISAGAQVNAIENIKVNGTVQSITSKAIDITVPTNNNQLTNGAGYQTSSEVQSAINTALSGITGIDFQPLQTGEYNAETKVPTIAGAKGIIYLVPLTTAETNNIYYEWIYVNNAFEKIGTTEVDLSEYEKAADIKELSNTEIDNVLDKVE